MSIKIIHEECDPELATDKTLPYTSYLVRYLKEGNVTYDIVNCNKKVDLFDYYYDLYKKDFLSFVQSKGNVNPKFWNYPTEAKKPKKKKSR